MDFGSARFSQDNEYGFQGRILPFSASSSSSSSSSSNQFKVTMLADPPIKNPIWDPSLMQYNHRSTTENTESPPQDDEGRGRGRGDYDDCRNNDNVFVEKEHMFDKVVTPSDVGKLNRLVIPKQHAEKYFPLDSTTHDKGLLLNFDDRHGKSWRFRYSYWTSSQSYVMTKGWSRFVKEKRLDAGDVVSFKRGVGEVGKDRFYIDWRRRPDMTTADPLNIFHHHNHSSIPHHFQLQQWSQPVMRPVGVGLATSLSAPRDHTLISHLHNPYRNNIMNNTNGHGIVSFSGGSYGYGTVVNPCHGGPVFYLRSAAPSPTPLLPMALGSCETEAEPIVIESVPVAHEKAAAKRLRLFGVNMECPIPESDEEDINVMSPHSTMVSETENRLQFEVYNGRRPDFFDKGKSSSSMSLDFGT